VPNPDLNTRVNFSKVLAGIIESFVVPGAMAIVYTLPLITELQAHSEKQDENVHNALQFWSSVVATGLGFLSMSVQFASTLSRIAKDKNADWLSAFLNIGSSENLSAKEIITSFNLAVKKKEDLTKKVKAARIEEAPHSSRSARNVEVLLKEKQDLINSLHELETQLQEVLEDLKKSYYRAVDRSSESQLTKLDNITRYAEMFGLIGIFFSRTTAVIDTLRTYLGTFNSKTSYEHISTVLTQVINLAFPASGVILGSAKWLNQVELSEDDLKKLNEVVKGSQEEVKGLISELDDIKEILSQLSHDVEQTKIKAQDGDDYINVLMGASSRKKFFETKESDTVDSDDRTPLIKGKDKKTTRKFQ